LNPPTAFPQSTHLPRAMDSIKFNGHLNQQLFITNCDNSQKDDLDKFLFIFLMSILLDSIIGDSEI